MFNYIAFAMIIVDQWDVGWNESGWTVTMHNKPTMVERFAPLGSFTNDGTENVQIPIVLGQYVTRARQITEQRDVHLFGASPPSWPAYLTTLTTPPDHSDITSFETVRPDPPNTIWVQPGETVTTDLIIERHTAYLQWRKDDIMKYCSRNKIWETKVGKRIETD